MPDLDKIELHRLRIPLFKPYRLSFGAVENYEIIAAEITDRHGCTGLGEANIITGYTDETIDDGWRAACEFAARIARTNSATAKSEAIQFGEQHPFTASAFGTALEMLESPPLLTAAKTTPVPLLGLLNSTEEDAIQAEFDKLLASGFRTIKLKVGFNATEDARFVRTVQKVVNGRAKIRIDANQGFTSDDGIAFVKNITPQDIELFEQPCAAGDWDSHMAVARAAEVPMMLDESIYSLADIDKAASLKAATYIKVKLMKLVTLDALVHAIAHIRARGMQPVLGNGVACDLGCWLEACVAARHIDNAGEMNGFLKPRANLLAQPLTFRDGALWLQPGYTPQLHHDVIERYRVDTHTAS
ncbi:MAG: enolase C-terminal domain-like protein [Burkholderiales bacterium]